MLLEDKEIIYLKLLDLLIKYYQSQIGVMLNNMRRSQKKTVSESEIIMDESDDISDRDDRPGRTRCLRPRNRTEGRNDVGSRRQRKTTNVS